MIRLIKYEVNKVLLKKSVLITWILSLLLAKVLIHNATVAEVYADAFYKSYGYAPVMGLLMFMIVSASYNMEYNSNMKDLINTTVNGKKKLVRAKSIGGAIAVSLVNLSIVLTIYLDGITRAGFKGLDIKIKDLWYFKGVNSNLNVMEMMIIVIITIILVSYFFTQLGLYLSSISKNAAIPFIFGDLIMGLPYILENFISGNIVAFSPLWGMISFQLIKYNADIKIIIFQGIIFGAGAFIFPRLTYMAFTKEN